MSDLYNLPAAMVAGSEAGSYVIKIDRYSSIKGRVKPGDCLKSDPLSVGGHIWAVTYYPNGTRRHNEKPADYISVYLLLDSDMAKGVNAKARFSLLDKDGKTVESQSRTMECFFPRQGSTLGFGEFVKKADLEGSPHLIDDSFSIRCDFTVMKHIHKGNKSDPVPPRNLHLDLGNLLKSKDGADVIFRVGGESFSAHRYILAARSSVFRAELFGVMKENVGTPIEISDMESDVFRSLLHFIYTDSLPHGDDAHIEEVMASHLLVAADRYNIERLKLICEKWLSELIGSDNVATSLALAEQHGFHRIKEACLEFLSSLSNLEAMMASDGYEYLKSNCPSVLKELAASFLPPKLKAVKDIFMSL